MMAPRGYDRYMVVVGAGRNRKFVRFTDSERCAHFLGVLSIAAQSPRRGYLLISEGEEAGPEEVANEAAVTLKSARSAVEKLKRIGVLLHDAEIGAWRVRDWDEINPPPGSSTDRVRRYRANQRNAEVTANGTEGVTEALREASPEVEVEEEQLLTSSLRSDVVECFAYWQEKCGHKQAKLTPERHRKVEQRLKQGYTVQQIRQAIEGAAGGAFVSESGKRFDDIELICRNGSKLEDFMTRATPANGNVVPMQRDAVRRANAWQSGYGDAG